MAEQTRREHAVSRRSAPQERDGERSITRRGREVTAAIDGLLDEIDAVLEQNADEMVKGYVQQGG